MSIKDRSNEKFREFYDERGWEGCSGTPKEILAFFAAELTLLAEEVASGIATPVGEFEKGDNAGLFHAANLIKQKANELK